MVHSVGFSHDLIRRESTLKNLLTWRNALELLTGLSLMLAFVGCQKNGADSDSKELWIYTSLYKDTISDITPRLEKDFPGVKFNFYQAGSEEIATKVNAELISGQMKADVLISSDRFWYEEMGKTGKLHNYQSKNSAEVPKSLKSTRGDYSTLSIPVMVLSYNSDVIANGSAPKTFKEMSDPKWKGKFSTGSPLASGTNFTTVSMLLFNYGWKYFEALRKNDTISQGGNSAVVRRMQSKERPVGWVLLENILRFKGKDERLKIVLPKDGVVIQSNVIAITKKKGKRELAEKFVDWMYAKQGQEAMIRSYMYSPMAKYAPPVGAPPFATIRDQSFPWTQKFLDFVVENRSQIKERFAEIMFE